MNKEQRDYTVQKIEEYKVVKDKYSKGALSEMFSCAVTTAGMIAFFCNDHNFLGGVCAVLLGGTIIASIEDLIAVQGYERDIRNLEYSLEMDKLETSNQEIKENDEVQSKGPYSKNIFKRNRR